MSLIPTSTSTEFLLDTNVAIDFLNKTATAVAKVGPAAVLIVPITVCGELFYGAEHSARVAENLAKVEAFVGQVRVLSCDLETAHCFGRVRHELIRKGRPIQENDMWIAAVAIQHRLPLITADSDFGHVSGLTVIPW